MCVHVYVHVHVYVMCLHVCDERERESNIKLYSLPLLPYQTVTIVVLIIVNLQEDILWPRPSILSYNRVVEHHSCNLILLSNMTTNQKRRNNKNTKTHRKGDDNGLPSWQEVRFGKPMHYLL
jgi:hypothetical protein